MLVRNRVRDFGRWRVVFEEQGASAFRAGLHLRHLWQSFDDPNDVFFLFEVDDIDRANAFVNAPESAEAGERAGVIDGEITYLVSARVVEGRRSEVRKE